VAHWLFAAKYHRIGTEMPLIVQGLAVPDKVKKSRRIRDGIFLALNIIFPVSEAVVLTFFNLALFDKDRESSSAIKLSVFIVVVGFLVCQVITGVYMIDGIFKIRRFYREKEITSKLNLRAMLLGGGAFGIYLFSHIVSFGTTVFWFISYAHNNDNENNKFMEVYFVMYLIWVASSALSQVMLDIIFWQLGEKVEEIADDDEEEN